MDQLEKYSDKVITLITNLEKDVAAHTLQSATKSKPPEKKTTPKLEKPQANTKPAPITTSQETPDKPSLIASKSSVVETPTKPTEPAQLKPAQTKPATASKPPENSGLQTPPPSQPKGENDEWAEF